MIDYGISGKTAIVTGGSVGIGRACATALAGQGVNVAIVARRLDRLEQAAKEISEATGGKVIAISADMTQTDDVKRMVSETVKQFGGVDILVNNAASFPYGSSTELTVDDWLAHFNVKAFGYLRCMFEVLPYMKQAGWGRIINIAGQAARAGGGSAGANNAAIINMTKGFALDLAAQHITVNAVHPGGPSDTDRDAMKMEYDVRTLGITMEQAKAAAEARKPPIGRHVVSADAAHIVLFLAAAQSSAITGETMAVDPGADRTVIY